MVSFFPNQEEGLKMAKLVAEVNWLDTEEGFADLLLRWEGEDHPIIQIRADLNFVPQLARIRGGAFFLEPKGVDPQEAKEILSELLREED